MKKLISLLLALILTLPALALADLPDISGLTLDELYQLKSAVCSEILARSEWKTVEVPAGYYIVGEDIPEGHWTIRYKPGEVALIEYFLKADASGHRPADTLNDYFYLGIGDPDHQLAVTYENTEIDLDLKAGYHFVVNYGPVIFEPFTKRPSPFF